MNVVVWVGAQKIVHEIMGKKLDCSHIEADSQYPRRILARAPDALFDIMPLLQMAARVSFKFFAFCRQFEPRRRAYKKGRADLLFKLCDRLGQPLLADIHLFRSARKRTFLAGGKEIFKLFVFHAPSLGPASEYYNLMLCTSTIYCFTYTCGLVRIS
ncbi:hypothetical protein SDC9_195568 [bioreactor metagenome]|uniref:Uncharacterized protein n=1 Tax=bioreactor metagenome TaxID=1076179 RepID=A0A645II29_9ZZZZ